jgi:hypothetical protein
MEAGVVSNLRPRARRSRKPYLFREGRDAAFEGAAFFFELFGLAIFLSALPAGFLARTGALAAAALPSRPAAGGRAGPAVLSAALTLARAFFRA